MAHGGWSPLDYAGGVCHFLFDRVPGGLPVVPPRPRLQNAFRRDGLPLVARVNAGVDIRESVSQCLDLLGGPGLAVKRGDAVFVKPNFNSPDPFPGSTDLPFLKAVLELLLDAGARVTLGDCAGLAWRPTRKVFQRLGLPDLCRKLGVCLIPFEDRARDWVQVEVNGEYLKKVVTPRSAYEADRLVYLPCLRTHTLSRFSMALKLSMGFVHPGQRRMFHAGRLEQKVAEINLAWQPDLIVVDGRKAFVRGGPNRGELVEPRVMLASGDLVAVDIEGAKTLLGYGARNRLLPDPVQMPQIATALRHGLGEARYALISLHSEGES